MKKKLLTASIVLLLLVPFLFSGCHSVSPAQKGFAIYLTERDIPPAQMEVLSRVAIAPEPVIAINDVISYEWNTHTVTLTKDAYDRVVALKVPTGGKSFVVCVDDSPLYWGAFWTPISSQSFAGVIIMVPPFPPGEIPGNSIQIGLGYPGQGFYKGEDPRANGIIKSSLEKAGKLK